MPKIGMLYLILKIMYNLINKSKRYVMEHYHKILDAAGIRPSVQRVAVYSYLCEHPIHPTVETLFAALSPDYPTLSKTTIYNTLKLFEQKNLVRAVKIEDDKLRYDAEMQPHIHFKCEKCGRVFDVYDDTALPAFMLKCNDLIPTGFTMSKMQANLWGVCADCAK